MRSLRAVASVLPVLLGWLVVPPGVDGSSAPPDAYHIVLSRSAVGPGEHVEMRLVPPLPPGVRVRWPVATGKSQRVCSANYRAPYVIPVGATPVRVAVSISGPDWRTIVSTEISLLPGSVPGAEDCLGPDQSFSPTEGTIVQDPVPADGLPQVIHAVAPEYPRSSLARGVEDRIPVRALLCRTGRVLDAYVPYSYVEPGDQQPIEHDPKLVEAALAAVRQYVFSPATQAGQPIAVWIGTVVVFDR